MVQSKSNGVDFERLGMTDIHRFKRNAELVDRMWTTLGLEEKVFEGQLDSMTLVDPVLRCSGCSNPDGCDLWLKTHVDTGARATPVMCRNTNVFDHLTKGTRA